VDEPALDTNYDPTRRLDNLKLKSSKDWLTLSILLIVWGLNYPAVKFGLQYATPLAFSFYRVLIGTIVSLPIALRSRNQFKTFQPKAIIATFLFASTSSVIFLAFWFIGETMVPAGITAVIIYTYPLFTVLLTKLFLADRLTWLSGVGILAGFAGTLLVVTSGNLSTGVNSYGFTLLIISSVSFACSFIIYRKWLIGYDRATVNATQLLFASAILFVWTLTSNSKALYKIQLANIDFLAVLLYTSVLGTSVAYLIWMSLVDKRGPVWLSAWLFLVPVVALGSSIVLLGEQIDLVQLIGFTVIVLGIGAVNRK
jgi:drug/metabolite transporter (DMT)-like permease